MITKTEFTLTVLLVVAVAYLLSTDTGIHLIGTLLGFPTQVAGL